jgi:transcriptional regulator with XRE-family HTH domain
MTWKDTIKQPCVVPAHAWAELRHEAGLTQKAIAEKIGMSLSAWRKWEQGKALGPWCALFAAAILTRSDRIPVAVAEALEQLTDPKMVRAYLMKIGQCGEIPQEWERIRIPRNVHWCGAVEYHPVHKWIVKTPDTNDEHSTSNAAVLPERLQRILSEGKAN